MNLFQDSHIRRNFVWLTILSLSTLAVIGFYQLRLNRVTATDYTSVEATITAFSTTDYNGATPPRAAVVAVTDDGVVGRALVSPAKIRGCKIGDTIAAARKGSALKLFPAPCRPKD